ncbi:MAG: urease accessory protein UreD [Symploca sp. SIO1A3]|nr:urease accessory protein UreD [Symploca sp. SIO2C1]NER50228.1 urease accessory protein UreD [Symploca sp. SIO1A3]
MNQLNQEQIAKGWHGSLDLVYAHHNDATRLIHNQVRSPLKVQRAFYPEGQAICHSIVLHTAGGIVGGDRLSQNIHLQANSQVLITTAAAGKVYRSNGQEARQTIQIRVEPGAYLEWLPQETIIFNGAVYRQDLRVELAPGASWLGWEITRFGRTARGEQFLQGNWQSHSEVWQQGHPLWIERQWLPGSDTIFNSPHGLAGEPVVGMLCWLSQPVTSDLLEQVRKLWRAKEHQGEAGVTQLISGLLCRYRGASTSEVRDWFTDVWQLLRLSYSGHFPKKPRVWLS